MNNALDDIYHSNDMYEMKLKADLHGVDLDDIDVIKFLANTTAYHAAYYPHAIKRFDAFKQLLKANTSIVHNEHLSELMTTIARRINELLHEVIRPTPGAIQYAKNLHEIFDILRRKIRKEVQKTFGKKTAK